jgi:hypothetical protein
MGTINNIYIGIYNFCDYSNVLSLSVDTLSKF